MQQRSNVFVFVAKTIIMKRCLIFSLAIITSSVLFAQPGNVGKVPGRTQFYAELGGVTADEDLGNYNYELRSVVTVPAQVNYIFGKGDSPHTFEVGAGITYVGRKLDIFNFYDDKTSNVFGTASFMYRRQPIKGGFTWRIGFTPLIANGYIQPSGGVSVGYSF